MTQIHIPTANVIKTDIKPKPFTGYVAVSHVLMQREGFSDFLFDNFRMVRDITTSQDRQLGLNRFLMQSLHFTEGYGQYKIRVEHQLDGSLVITSVSKVA